jgi:hypothetical protein
MNAHSQAVLKSKKEAPLFASTWMALFFLLRREWSTPRAEK